MENDHGALGDLAAGAKDGVTQLVAVMGFKIPFRAVFRGGIVGRRIENLIHDFANAPLLTASPSGIAHGSRLGKRRLRKAAGEKGRQEHEGARSRPKLRLKKKGRCTSAAGTRFTRRCNL
ncbi:hypothetical protein RHECNPAF_570017 [Rhizobium etli CNPAF512]|nr:hypothetical protein RHECNPAF_570017 [Rhizobium etli CNPAF512]